MLKAFRDQCTVETVALRITLEVDDTEIAYVVAYLVRRVCQSLGQSVCDLFMSFVINQR
jgi:hypothetical protein